MRRREEPSDLIECRDCGSEFDLAAQYYYDSLCPNCKKEQDEDTSAWPACTICGDRFRPGTGTLVDVRNPNARDGYETVSVCSNHCRKDYEGTQI